MTSILQKTIFKSKSTLQTKNKMDMYIKLKSQIEYFIEESIIFKEDEKNYLKYTLPIGKEDYNLIKFLSMFNIDINKITDESVIKYDDNQQGIKIEILY